LPALINKLNDNVPRVISHVLSAIGNFFEGAESSIIKEYTNRVLI